MEFGRGIVESLENKSILVTGATGFLAKVFVEKLLRVQPDVKRLYLVLRAPDSASASERLQNEIIGKDLFKVLKEKHGKGFESFVSSKLCPIAGDIAEENLGIKDIALVEAIQRETNVVVNVAATTTFNERYDVALNINVLGAKHALDFAKKCAGIEIFLHVSTAYVAGSKEGVLLEKRFQLGETLNGSTGLDVDQELSLVQQTLKDLHDANESSEYSRAERRTMKDLGMERARHFGWPNTYVFTKAMGEMVLGHLRGSLPLVIIRPTIITSILNDPLPGWMEGTRTIDSLIVGYAKGKLPCFLGDLDLIMDVVPGDMVSNAMIAAMAAHSNQLSFEPIVYHVSSSVRNPVKYHSLLDCAHRYFVENPRVGKDGSIIKVRRIPVLNTVTGFNRYMRLKYKLPLEGLRLVNAAFCRVFNQRYNDLNKEYNFVMYLAELYAPFALFKGCFDDTNLEKLRAARMHLQVEDAEADMFSFDPKSINWDQYLFDVHIPGLLKYVMK